MAALISSSSKKVGTFDWIFEFGRIASFFDSAYTGIFNRSTSRILVAGCGTSKLSAQLADIGFGEVVSVDNDVDCIAHMSELHRNDSRMQWFVHDLVEPQNTISSFHGIDGSFDMIVDKGTLDAILVEGSIYTMLYEIHRLIRMGGCYVVFSINTEQLLAPLLSMESLGFHVTCHEIVDVKLNGHNGSNENGCNSSNNTVGGDAEGLIVSTVAICTKIRETTLIDRKQLENEERMVLDRFFQQEQPYLTAEEENRIRVQFESMGGHENEFFSLDLQGAYNVMFDRAMGGMGDELEYSFDMFLHDVKSFILRKHGYMNADEAIEFLRTVQ